MTHGRSCTLVVDGGADLPEDLVRQYHIQVVPLTVHFGAESYQSGVTITPAEFYQRLKARGEFPTTSQPSVGDYVAAYQRAAEHGLPILSLHLSSGLSGSYNAARAACSLLPHLDITQVDTMTLSGEMSLQVLVAAEMAERGLPVAEICDTLRAINARSHLYFTIDKLDYLRKGGRIGRVAGAVGGLLGIRPIVTVDKSTGTYIAVGKARSFRRAVEEVAQRIIDEVGEGNEVSLMVLEGYCPEQVAHVVALLRSRLNVIWFHHLHVNPSLGAHVGPDALGVAYFPGPLPYLARDVVAAD
ncbi:DegV family protein with EDD domain [Symbiobacterium terraclitae]|uniref:DegV family protein with EDD domain n=1 Tax=Symbiobacterium terraclitae TaxID=557451 RepID=A0ABS4JS29_9FIRM|nr:DegV family protein [Symbiobacterium terraclitae]MBP2018341.1 DegV family protein with EDD domain [Symbiobacterium terraclitae]